MFDLIKIIITMTLVIYLPGLLLYNILFSEKKLKIIESVAVLFTAGVSLYIIPSLSSYLLHLSWNFFIIIWLTEILLIVIYLVNKKLNPFRILDQDFVFYDYIISILMFLIVMVMLIHGGHFIGDASAHLSYIMRLDNLENIDAYSPMFKNVKEVPYPYAYCMWYLVIVFLKKISGVELRILWDLSSAVFSPIISSAVYFFARKVINKMEFVFIVLLGYYFFEFTYSWLNFKFLPYPDQIARNILLYVALGMFFIRPDRKGDLYRNAIFLSLIAIMITLTHMYSFFVFFVMGFIFFLVLVLAGHSQWRKKFIKIYISVFLINLPFLFLRLFFSNYLDKFLNS